MIGADDVRMAGDAVDDAVTERGPRLHGHAFASQNLPPGVECDPSKRHYHSNAPQLSQLGFQMRLAGEELVRSRFVFRRRASHDRCDERVSQA